MPRSVKQLPGRKPNRDRIIMVRHTRAKIVTLQDGRMFKANLKRATQADLLCNVDFPRIYKQRAAPKRERRQQRDRGFKSALGKAFKLVKKVAGSKTFKNIVKAAIAEVPGAIEKLSGKVKNKRLKSILGSDMTKTGLDLAPG